MEMSESMSRRWCLEVGEEENDADEADDDDELRRDRRDLMNANVRED